MHSTHPPVLNATQVIESDVMRLYIKKAKTYSPKITAEVSDFLVNAYTKMRKNHGETEDFQLTCPRTLLSIMRMASALARLQFSDEVTIADAEEALRLIEVSKASITETGRVERDPISVIFEEAKGMSVGGDGSMASRISVADIRERIVRKGYSEELLDECIEKYEGLNVWMRAGGGDELMWMGMDDI